jgi:lysophospholipid acyltransferase
LDPKTSQPTSHKIYYDIFSYFVTQITFSFTTAPFVLLTLPASFLVWARVYFYGAVGTALATAFFASPAKAVLVKKLNKRAGTTTLKRTASQDSLSSKEPVLGLPAEPEKDLDELVGEVKAEIEARQRKEKAKEKEGVEMKII